MPKNLTVNGSCQEALMEAMSILMNLLEDIKEMLSIINENQTGDHANDVLRVEAQGFIFDALKALSINNHDEALRNLHASIQRFQKQAVADLQDDEPRTKLKIKIEILKVKILNHIEALKKTIARIQNAKVKNGA